MKATAKDLRIHSKGLLDAVRGGRGRHHFQRQILCPACAL